MAVILKKRSKTLLIDADSLLYEACSVNEIAYEFGAGNRVVEANFDGAIASLNRSIQNILDATKCKNYLMYITGKHNFRYDLLPSYKHNRADALKPILLEKLKEYALGSFACKMTTKIEADDACSIHLSKDPKNHILAHIDKDLNQVEGLHYNWRKDSFYELSYVEGQRAFYEQVLSGDSTDGYIGCPNIGAIRAKEIIDGYIGVLAYEHRFSKGARKGESELRWADIACDDIWDAIISQYLKGHYKLGSILDYKDIDKAQKLALIQARVARMLRWDEFKGGKVILWSYKPLKIDLKSIKAYKG